MSQETELEHASGAEVPVFFGESDHLFGIFTQGRSIGPIGALICLTPSLDESRIGARLGRRLAEAGIQALRFDLEGSGESEPGRQPSEDAGFLAASEWMSQYSESSLVVIGGSAGARAALAAAKGIEGLSGFVSTRLSLRARSESRSHSGRHPGPVGRAQKALQRVSTTRSKASGRTDPDWEGTADPRALGQLQALVESRVPLLFVSGSEDTDYLRIQRQLSKRVVDFDQTSIVSAKVDSRTLKDFKSIAGQSQYLRVVVDWVSALRP